MSAYHYPIIAREGWPWIAVSVTLALLLCFFYACWAGIPFWGITLWCVFVFRDPYRKIPSIPLAVVSPVDGRVVKLESIEDKYLHRPVLRVVIRMNWFNVFSLRSPIEGKVNERWYSKDEGSKAFDATLWVQSDEQDDVVFSIIGGLFYWKPQCSVQLGERVGQGQRCGFMLFGQCVELLLPVTARLLIQKGDKVLSGSSVIANLLRNTNNQRT